MYVTRRTLARVLAATAVVQVEAPAQTDDPLKAAREEQNNNAQRLAKVSLPMNIEPAFHFKP
jgi:hypothetical protein